MTILYRFLRLLSFILLSAGAIYIVKCNLLNTVILLVIIFFNNFMTYCVAICLEEGLVFLSDTRTNAGVDDIGTFRKMTIYKKSDQRIFTLLSAGNLAISQAVKEIIQ